MNSVYPFVYATDTPVLLNDEHLIALVRERCGDEVAWLLRIRLYGDVDDTTVRDALELLNESLVDIDSLQCDISNLKDFFEKIKGQLPAGGVLRA